MRAIQTRIPPRHVAMFLSLGSVRRPFESGFGQYPATPTGYRAPALSRIHRMLAAVITRPGGPEVLEIRDVPPPTVGEADVLVRVRASALNRADILQRIGGYAAPPGSPAQIPGLEYAGEILEVGTDVRGFQPGDRVFGIAGGGAHAEMIAIPARTVARVPSGLSWTDAGAIPEAFITAHDALVTQ